MKYTFFNKDATTSHKIAIASTFTSFVLAIVVLIQAYGLSTKRERLVIMPPTIDQQYQIQWDTANVEYYKKFALVLSGLIGQVNKKNIGTLKTSINVFLAPALQRPMAESLESLASKLPNDNFTSWFEPVSTQYEYATQKIFVIGSLKSSVIGSQVQSQPVVYEYIFKMEAGKPVATHFDSYEGSKPRTRSVIHNEKVVNSDPNSAKAIANKGTQ